MTFDLLATSHSFTSLSSPQETISLESGENWAHRTQFECAGIEYWNLLSQIVHTFTVLSSEADTNNEPSPEKLTDLTAPVCPLIALECP